MSGAPTSLGGDSPGVGGTGDLGGAPGESGGFGGSGSEATGGVTSGSGGQNSPTCGDGNVGSGESCDDAGESATCDGDCTSRACGDGVVNATAREACDDAGDSASCNASCTVATCGDDYVNPVANEECEPGLNADCAADCTFTYAHFIANRYSFDGTGTTLVDSVGGADGSAIGTVLSDTGQLSLPNAPYGDLQNGIASAHADATFEVWATWNGGAIYQRIFDLGSSDAGEGSQGEGLTYLLLMPQSETGNLRATFSDSGTPSDVVLNGAGPMPTGVLTHLAVVADDSNDIMALYVNGAFVAQALFDESLASLGDQNNWLGRSQFATDPAFDGAIEEFRIYEKALDAQEILASYTAGPDI